MRKDATIGFLTLALAALGAGCAATPPCGAGELLFYDKETGEARCAPVAGEVKCGVGTVLSSGTCVPSPDGGLVTCGEGTKYDEKSNQCIGTGGGDVTPPPCPTPKPGKFCMNGVIRRLKDNAVTKGDEIEVRVYAPLAFLRDPKSKPINDPPPTFKEGTYVIPDIDYAPLLGLGLVAVVTTDKSGPSRLVLAGVGEQNITDGAIRRLDAIVIERDLVNAWEKAAGTVGVLESHGYYFGRFFDKVRLETATAKPVAGVKLQYDGADATNAYYFKDDLMRFDLSPAAVTDVATGAVMHKAVPSLLPKSYGGKGGMINGKPVNWESPPGGSAPGVVFTQRIHPM